MTPSQTQPASCSEHGCMQNIYMSLFCILCQLFGFWGQGSYIYEHCSQAGKSRKVSQLRKAEYLRSVLVVWVQGLPGRWREKLLKDMNCSEKAKAGDRSERGRNWWWIAMGFVTAEL